MALRVLKNSRAEYVREFYSGEDIPGEDGNLHIDAETALKYSAVFACCRVLGETFASAPFLLYRKTEDGRELVTDHPLYEIMHNRPNEEMSPFAYKECMMNSLNLGGNAVAEKLLGSRGELLGLYPYPHNMVKIERDRETKKLIYRIGNGAEEKVLRRDQVFHVAGPSLDGVVGLSPISYAAGAIRLGKRYETFGNSFFRNAALPSGAFTKEGALSPESFMRLKDEVKKNFAGLTNAGTPMILEDGLEWKQMTVNPTDAQLLESKYFQIEDICRIYRVPQHLVNKLDRSTNNNIEHQSLEFAMYTMLPWFKRREEAKNAQLLTREDRKARLYGEYKIDGLMRGDSKSRAFVYASGRQWGWLSANDIRRLENMPPIEGGDRYLEPANMSEAGAQQAATAMALDEIKELLERR
jgi:HK97 family phage portal protein